MAYSKEQIAAVRHWWGEDMPEGVTSPVEAMMQVGGAAGSQWAPVLRVGLPPREWAAPLTLEQAEFIAEVWDAEMEDRHGPEHGRPAVIVP